MIRKGSRYEKAKSFTADLGRGFSFQGVRAREIGRPEGVLEHVIREGERLDHLALHYYNDVHKWYRILDANPDILFGAVIEEGSLDGLAGQTLLIPRLSDPGDGKG